MTIPRAMLAGIPTVSATVRINRCIRFRLTLLPRLPSQAFIRLDP